MMKKLVSLMLVGAMALSLVACGSSTEESAESTTTETAEAEDTEEAAADTEEAAEAADVSEYAVAMITDYGDITDQSFNQTTYEACKAFCEEQGIDFKYYKPAGDSTAERVASVEQAID